MKGFAGAFAGMALAFVLGLAVLHVYNDHAALHGIINMIVSQQNQAKEAAAPAPATEPAPTPPKK